MNFVKDELRQDERGKDKDGEDEYRKGRRKVRCLTVSYWTPSGAVFWNQRLGERPSLSL